MKKLFSMMLIMVFMLCVFSSCLEKESVPDISIPKSIYLKVGETYDLKHINPWDSSNDFVATVNGLGVITAKRVGTTEISAYNLSQKCTVNVAASYTLYSEPVTNWGIGKSELKRLKGTPDSETSTALVYSCSSSYAPIEMYMFEDNSLVASGKLVKTACSEQLVDHLMQRYKALRVDTENYDIYFMDGETLGTSDMVIVASLYNTSYWMVGYMPNPTKTRGKMDKEALFDFMRKEIESSGVVR